MIYGAADDLLCGCNHKKQPLINGDDCVLDLLSKSYDLSGPHGDVALYFTAACLMYYRKQFLF